ncbi:alpha/beta hydrolase family protein [Pseudonocardia benzenivorans]
MRRLHRGRDDRPHLPATAQLLYRSSPASVTDRITAPTLLVQGEQDTLFGLDQADANARQIAAAGGTVRVVWYAGGHDGSAPGQSVRDDIAQWFDHYLMRSGPAPTSGFAYAVQSGIRAGSTTPTGRTIVADTYPGLAGNPPVAAQHLPLRGSPQDVVNPARGNPAAITSLPGLGGSIGSLAAQARRSPRTCRASRPSSAATRSPRPRPSPGRRASRSRCRGNRGSLRGDEAVLFGRISTRPPTAGGCCSARRSRPCGSPCPPTARPRR